MKDSIASIQLKLKELISLHDFRVSVSMAEVNNKYLKEQGREWQSGEGCDHTRRLHFAWGRKRKLFIS